MNHQQTGGDSDRKRTVVDLFAGEEHVDRVKSRYERSVLDIPQVSGLLSDDGSHGVLSALGVYNADVHHPSAAAYTPHNNINDHCVRQVTTDTHSQ